MCIIADFYFSGVNTVKLPPIETVEQLREVNASYSAVLALTSNHTPEERYLLRKHIRDLGSILAVRSGSIRIMDLPKTSDRPFKSRASNNGTHRHAGTVAFTFV
jgi:hypothetical protein